MIKFLILETAMVILLCANADYCNTIPE